MTLETVKQQVVGCAHVLTQCVCTVSLRNSHTMRVYSFPRHSVLVLPSWLHTGLMVGDADVNGLTL